MKRVFKFIFTILLISNIFSNSTLANGILNDEYKKYNWAYKRIIGNKNIISSQKIKIAVIDSGIDGAHPELKDNLVHGRNYIKGTSEYEDVFGHGTQIAGVIDTINPNAKLLSYKVMNSMNDGESETIIQAIYDAVDDGVHIINISSGSYKDPNNVKDKEIIEKYTQAIQYAKKNNVIIVASAGNDGRNMLDYNKIHVPSDIKEVVRVGATNKKGELANYSNYGDIDLVAPSGYFGENYAMKKIIDVTEMTMTYSPIKSVNYFGKAVGLPEGYTLSFGTSIATAMVTASLSVVIQENPNISGEKAVELLIDKAKDMGEIGYDKYFGYGEVRL